jgi:hypothetical protein
VWVTNGSGDGVEPVGGLGVEAVHEVSVAVDGDLDGAVSESGLDGFGVYSGGDEPGSVGVAEVVDAARWSDGVVDCLSPDPSKRSSSEKASLVGGPDHVVDGWMLLEVSGEGVGDDLGKGDSAF